MIRHKACLTVVLLYCFQPGQCGEKKEDPAKKKVAPDDLITLAPYLLQVSIVPDEADEASIGSANNTEMYIAWKEKMEKKLKQTFEQANIATKPAKAEEPVVKIVKTELIKLEESKNVKIQFYVTLPPEGRVLGSKAERIYKNLGTSELWDTMGRDVLAFPTAVQATESEDNSSRTLAIIAFVMGWVCLAALIVILAYLGIKYRDGIKSLARRIEHWSNPNRNGYSNLGGDVHTNDWRTETDTRGPYEELEREEAKPSPKKKLRAPGGLLTDVEEGEAGHTPAPAPSYGTYESNAGIEMQTKIAPIDTTQVRLSELAQSGEVTPPLTPTSMQKHLIKKYQEKQVEEATRGSGDEPLTATNSEIFPDDFADCVEEEEIFQINP